MPEQTFRVNVIGNLSDLNREIDRSERKISSLSGQIARARAAGTDERQLRRSLREERRITDGLREQRRAIEEKTSIAEQGTAATRRATRAEQRIARTQESLARRLDRDARSRLGRSATLQRNIRDAGPLGFASAGFGLIQGGIGGVLAGAGVGAGVATGVGAAAAGVAAIAALPVILGAVGTPAAIAAESVENLRQSLAAIGREQGFVPDIQLARFQDALRGTVKEAQALTHVISIERLGIPLLSQNIDTFAVDIKNIAVATNREFDDVFESVRRFITRGAIDRVRDFLPGLDAERVVRYSRTLSNAEAQAYRARVALEEMGEEAEKLGDRFENGGNKVQDALDSLGRGLNDIYLDFGGAASGLSAGLLGALNRQIEREVVAIREIVEIYNAIPFLDDIDLPVSQIERRRFARVAGLTREQRADIEPGAADFTTARYFNILSRLDENVLRQITTEGANVREILQRNILGLGGVSPERTQLVTPEGQRAAGAFTNEQVVRAVRLILQQIDARRAVVAPPETLPTWVQELIARISPRVSGALTTAQLPGEAFYDRAFDGVDYGFQLGVSRGLAGLPSDLRASQVRPGLPTVPTPQFRPDISPVAFSVGFGPQLREAAGIDDEVFRNAVGVTREFSNSVVYLSETLTSATSQMIFNARSIEDVFRGLLQELYEQAAPSAYQSLFRTLGLTRGGG